MAKEQWAETAVGAVVIAAAGAFLAYSLTVGGKGAGHGYQVQAKFGQVGSLAPGAVVSVAGVKIGSGSRSESRRPSASTCPHTAPVAW